jgi:dihydroorotase
MPNLTPPVITVADALKYRDRIITAMANRSRQFNPLMVLYLTDNTSPKDIEQAAASPYIHAAKLYPAGATTNSGAGVTSIEGLYPILEKMEAYGLPLLVHGEVTDNHIDIFDREQVFIDRYLDPISKKFRALKIVLEHITTENAVQFVNESGSNVAATITAHHLLYNRNDLFLGGIRPHLFCLPILKRSTHQQALITAAISGDPKFFLGTDSAPHSLSNKENACGCAGCYTANAAIELYAEAFERANALDKLEGFASHFGPAFYDLPPNPDSITLVQQSQVIPDQLSFGDEQLCPIAAGETLRWQVKEEVL